MDVVAPGCEIVSLGLNGNSNTTMCGTSMATPYAAGVGALAAEIAAHNGRTLTPALLEDLLESTGVQVADPRYPPTAPKFPRVSPPGIKQSLELEVPATTASGVGTTSATVSWGSIAGATGYQVNVTSEITGDTETITVGGLTTTVPLGCGPHAITVRAVSSGGIPSLPSDPFVLTVRNCPAAVEDVTLTAIDDQSHTISWSVPDEPSGAIVLQRRSLHGQWGDVQTLPTSAVSHVDAVSSCGLVEYRVFAQDANADRSVASDVVRRGICAPANDEVAAATVLTQTPPGQAAQQITEPDAMWATSSLTDPVVSCTQGFAANTQWYTFTASAQGRVNIRTTSAGEPSTEVDPVLAVYEGSPGASNEVACSDDAGTSLDSDVTVNVTAGQTYFVMLGNWADVAGDSASVQKLAIQWLPVGTVDNDTFAGATVLTGAGFHSSVIAAGFATVASSDPAHQCARLGPRVGGGTLWWRYTPTANGKLNLSTIGSTERFADTLLSVYTGTEGSLSTVACNDDAVATVTYSSLSSVALQAGTTYSILVSSYSATMPGSANDLVTLSGTFTANAAIQPPVKPAAPVAAKTYRVSVKASKRTARATKRPKKVIVTVRNAGNAASRVRIKASKAPRGYTFVYRSAAGKNITKQVTAGKYRTAILKPGSSTRITVSLKLKRVRKSALAKKKATISIRVTSVAKPAASATAKVRVRR